MLNRISVKYFAIIEDLTVNFKSKMTVLTGQTGAGKSLIIDSISLLLGARADSDMIRFGCDKAFIEGEFSYTNPYIDKEIDRFGINKCDNLTIYREISTNGKNIIKVNNTNVTLVQLKSIASYLADIHVQHDTFRLINPDTYLSFIDNPDDDNFNKLINSYTLALDGYNSNLKMYKEIINKRDNTLERLEFIEYQYKELKELDLTRDIDLEIEEKISKLSNYDKIYKSLNESYENLENEYFSLDNIYNAYKLMDKISNYDNDYKENSDKLYEAYCVLEDVKSNIYKAINNLDYDEELLNSLNERLNDIEHAKAKYKMSVNELILYVDKIKLEIDLATNYDEVVKEYLLKVENSFNNVKDISIKITSYRKKEAIKISKAIISECNDLELSDTKFEIVFNDVDYSNPLNSSIFLDNGVDQVEFMISLNKGEPVKPLNKVASGGELSRIMLAFKSYFAKRSNLSLMVFDEIDSGVSGAAALKIARKMKSIGEITQVLCITHLPSVASIADNHLWIYKDVKNGRTITALEELTYDRRVEAIASMIGGDRITSSSLEMAKELLKEI